MKITATLWFLAFLPTGAACGSSGEEDSSHSATGPSSGTGSSSGGYCNTAVPGCLIETTLDSGNAHPSCIEAHTATGTEPPTFQSDCEAPTGDPDKVRTYLTAGCPRGSDLACGLVTEVSGAYGLTFFYISGNALLDNNSPCKTVCPTSTDMGNPECCPGVAYP